MILTATQLKSREKPEFAVDLGGGDEVWVRRPDLQAMVLTGLIPTPLLNEVIKTIAAWSGTNLTEVTEDIVQSSEKVSEFIDCWLIEAMVNPRASRDTPGPETVLLTDLTLASKVKIFSTTFNYDAEKRKAAVDAATRFPENGSGAGSPSDVSDVSTQAV